MQITYAELSWFAFIGTVKQITLYKPPLLNNAGATFYAEIGAIFIPFIFLKRLHLK